MLVLSWLIRMINFILFFMFFFIRHLFHFLFCRIVVVIVMRGKFLIPIVFSIVIGFFFGRVFFNSYDDSLVTASSYGEKVYFIQKGVYSSLDDLKKNNSDYKSFLYLKESDGFHLYIGITKNENIAKKIKEFYEKSNINIYVSEKYINNASFISTLSEYDKLIDVASLNSFVDLQKIVISNYKEMVLNGEESN